MSKQVVGLHFFSVGCLNQGVIPYPDIKSDLFFDQKTEPTLADKFSISQQMINPSFSNTAINLLNSAICSSVLLLPFLGNNAHSRGIPMPL